MNSLVQKSKSLFKTFCQTEWNAMTVGILVALFSLMLMAWWRPWGAVGGIRVWGEWILYGAGAWSSTPGGFLTHSSSVICIGLVAGAFLSACLGNDFAIRIPPPWEMVKAVIAGLLMGIGSALAGGCNVGGMYNAIGNLAANGFSMWLGLVIGVIAGLKYIYWEMEHITWGITGGKTIDFPFAVKVLLGLFTLALLIWGAISYSHSSDGYVASLSGILLVTAAIGYVMQRGRWCMVQAFREPHMTGNGTMAKSVAVSLVVLAIGGVVLKYAVPMRAAEVSSILMNVVEDIDPDEVDDEDLADTLDDVVDAAETAALRAQYVLNPDVYVRGTFGWGGVVGGFLFGFAAMLAGGCASGTLWRMGEGQVKLWMVVPFFGISNALMVKWFRSVQMEGVGITHEGSKLGYHIFLPDVMGYGGTLTLILFVMFLWYLIVEWNEESNRLIVEM